MFYLKEPNSKKKTLIIVQYYVAKDKAKFKLSTNIKINPDNWDKKNRIPIRKRGGSGAESQNILDRLNEINKKIDIIRSKLGKELTIGDLKLLFKINKDKLIYALEFLQEFIDERIKIGEVSKNSIYKHQILYKRIMEFELKTERQYKLTELNAEFFINFTIYLRQEHNLFDNTLYRYIGFFKTFLRWCLKKGYSPPMDFVDVHIKKQLADTIALSREEVKLIENAELTGAKDKARDLFLIGIYSGQRFSDYSVFEKADLRNNLIHKVAKKTGAMSFIPLTDKLKSILDKYEWVLPKISSQKFNKRIQKICKKLEINEEIKFTYNKGNTRKEEIKQKWEKISSHTARRTYITRAAEDGVADHLIMAVCGIKDPKTLNKYKKINKETLFQSTKGIF